MNRDARPDPVPDATGPSLQWLGQAGFIVKGQSSSVAFDPYLSDLCRTVYGLRRVVDPPQSPAEIAPDLVLVSHWHEDHLDLDSALAFVATRSRFVAPPSCIARLAGRGVPESALIPIRAGEQVEQAGAVIRAVAAAHRVPGFLTEDAIGFVVEMDGARIYHSGDTEYDRGLLQAAAHGPLDLALVCVNGTGGNMNAWEAALLCAQLRPTLAVPMHFGMWSPADYGPDATLDPHLFTEVYRRLEPAAQAHIPKLGLAFPAVNRG